MLALIRSFPNLATEGFTPTSAPDNRYNCIAWSLGDDSRWWWPDSSHFWPSDLPLASDVTSFSTMLESQGFSETSGNCYPPNANVDRIALYAKNGQVQHAARQLPNGQWTSKLGRELDISHTLAGLEGHTYGFVVAVFEKAEDT